MNKNISTVIFDVDHTITDEVSWYFITRSLGADESAHESIFLDFKEGRIGYLAAKAKLIELWLNTGNANKVTMKKLFSNVDMKHDAQIVIKKLSQRYRLCLISGSMDLFVECLAEKLNIIDWYANTKLKFDHEGKITDFDYSLEQSNKKLEHFKIFQNKYHLKTSECAIVGNGEGDLGLFRKLGLAILIESDEETKELLDLSDYKIRDLQEILDILI